LAASHRRRRCDAMTMLAALNYVLLTYAANEWLEHIQQCARHLGQETLQSLRDIVSTFAEVRENYSFQTGVENHHAARKIFRPFQEWSNVYELLIRMDGFVQKQRSGLLEQNGEYLPEPPLRNI